MEPERIAWGVWGLLSFMFLIVYLRWIGPPDEDQQKPSEMPKEKERQAEND